MATTPYLTFAHRPVEWIAARALLGDYHEWLETHVTVPVPASYWEALREELETLDVAFAAPNRLLVAWIGPVPVGTLGARHVDDTTAELTRCFVRPIARGQSIAPVMLGTRIAELRRAGYHRIVLETAPTDMAAAYAIYRRFGFTEASTADGHGGCDGIVAMELRLDAPEAPERAA